MERSRKDVRRVRDGSEAHPVNSTALAVGFVALLGGVAGCAPQAPAPSPPPATTAVSTAPATSAVPQESVSTATQTFSMPEPQDDAVARATLSGGQSASIVLDRATSGVSYLIRGACDGGPAARMSYVLRVDETEMSSGTWSCDEVVLDSGFVATKDETAQISFTGFQPIGADFSGFVEVVPAPS